MCMFFTYVENLSIYAEIVINLKCVNNFNAYRKIEGKQYPKQFPHYVNLLARHIGELFRGLGKNFNFKQKE